VIIYIFEGWHLNISKFEHEDAGVISAAVVERIVQQRLRHLLAVLAFLRQLDDLLVLAHVPQSIAGNNQVQSALVHLEFLIVWHVAHPLNRKQCT